MQAREVTRFSGNELFITECNSFSLPFEPLITSPPVMLIRIVDVCFPVNHIINNLLDTSNPWHARVFKGLNSQKLEQEGVVNKR